MSVVLIDRKLAASGDDQNPDHSRVTFDDFWKLYPKKKAKKDAFKAWMQTTRENQLLAVRALPAHRRSQDWRKDNGLYVPHAGTWLRGERWEDELDSDLTMGLCSWNCNGNRDGETRCTLPATVEKRGVCYCASHGERVR